MLRPQRATCFASARMRQPLGWIHIGSGSDARPACTVNASEMGAALLCIPRGRPYEEMPAPPHMKKCVTELHGRDSPSILCWDRFACLRVGVGDDRGESPCASGRGSGNKEGDKHRDYDLLEETSL